MPSFADAAWLGRQAGLASIGGRSHGVAMPVLSTQGLIEERCSAIARYHQRTGIARAQLDVSGGIDSSLMLALLAKALGPDKITAVFSSIHSSGQAKSLAQMAAQSCKVPLIELDLSQWFDTLATSMQDQAIASGYDAQTLRADLKKDPSILGSLRSCLRAPIGRGLNRMTRGGIRHGTGNECEDRFIRFYQKGGDGEVDTNPINMLSKGEVYQLAHAMGVPEPILSALPTPDLHANGNTHNDEDELAQLTGVAWTYSRIDPSTGEYQCLGTIEAMSRLLDRPGVQPWLFGDRAPSDTQLEQLTTLALRHEFRALKQDRARMLAWLRSARKMEASTRHKLNPSATGLGTRAELVAAGLLDDAVPWERLKV